MTIKNVEVYKFISNRSQEDKAKLIVMPMPTWPSLTLYIVIKPDNSGVYILFEGWGFDKEKVIVEAVARLKTFGYRPKGAEEDDKEVEAQEVG